MKNLFKKVALLILSVSITGCMGGNTSEKLNEIDIKKIKVEYKEHLSTRPMRDLPGYKNLVANLANEVCEAVGLEVNVFKNSDFTQLDRAYKLSSMVVVSAQVGENSDEKIRGLTQLLTHNNNVCKKEK